jgi:hypothetical protein
MPYGGTSRLFKNEQIYEKNASLATLFVFFSAIHRRTETKKNGPEVRLNHQLHEVNDITTHHRWLPLLFTTKTNCPVAILTHKKAGQSCPALYQYALAAISLSCSHVQPASISGCWPCSGE